MQVTVIGAGIVGIHSAHNLIDDGHQVTIVDPDGLAERTSRGNAGYIAHTDILPLASPKVWRSIPGWLVDPIGPLTIRPSYALKILPWMLRFVAASTPARIEESTKALIDLNGMTLHAWERRLKSLGLTEAHLRRKGYMYVFPSEGSYRANLPWLKRQQSLGMEVELLPDHKAVKRLEPAFSTAAAAGALYPAGVTVDDPASVCKAVGEAAVKRGAKLIQTGATGIRLVEGGVEVTLGNGQTLRSDSAVIAAGAWSKKLCAQLGDDIPLDTERGYNITMPKGSLGLSRPVIFEGQGIVSTPLDIGDRIGGAVEFAGLDAPPNYARVDGMIARARRFLPDGKFDTGTRWMGFRPSLPDSLPVISRSKASDRVIYAFGHAHHGLTQSAATGELVGALVSQKRTPIDTMPFRVERF